MSYEGREAYRCARCHEWAFIDASDKVLAQWRAEHAGGSGALSCPFCETGDLEYVGRVQQAEIVSEAERTACDDRCTHARGTICVCKCSAANHGSGRTVTVRIVKGRLEAVLRDMAWGQRMRPRLLAQIAEYDAAVALATAKIAETYAEGWRGHYAKRDLARAAHMHSHSGRMRVLKAVVSRCEAQQAVKARAGALAGGSVPQSPSGQQASAVVPAISPWPSVIGRAVATAAEMATERQVAYARSLVATRGTPQDSAVDLRDLTKADASRYIDTLLRMPVHA